MTPVRSLARAMLSGIFVVSGYRNFRNPDPAAVAAKPVTDKVAPMLKKAHPSFPTETETLIRLNAAVQVSAGLMLATGRFSRPAALVLAGTLVPVTIAGHPFWNNDDPIAKNNKDPRPEEPRAPRRSAARRGGHRRQARSAVADGHRIGHSRRSVQRAVRTARREARIAVRSATARRLPG